MRQILQNLTTGETNVVDVPVPGPRPGHLLITSSCSLVSSGTERMLVDFSHSSLVQKALKQPDRVRQVLRKAATDGVAATYAAVRSKLDEPLPLGYSNVGVVRDTGGQGDFEVGDRVVSNGTHAEVVSVPWNLCARIPDGVSDASAVFTVMGAIALQGIRLAAPTLGETFVVVGLGPIGLLAVQLLRANGCRVLGVDLDPLKCEMASGFGAEVINPSRGADVVGHAMDFSRGRGVDGVLLTLSSKSDEPVSQAALMCRKRGRLILVGVTGLGLRRDDLYQKEISLQVSCSYGPGRYDPAYEEHGQDYPVGFVRWTEQRNFEAVLDMMADGQINAEALVSHRFGVEQAADAYAVLLTDSQSNGILIEYPDAATNTAGYTIPLQSTPVTPNPGETTVTFVGAGNYAGRVLIPAFQRHGVRLERVVTRGGIAGVHYGKKYGFQSATTSFEEAIEGPELVIVVATAHDSHAEIALKALAAGKHVFVEKPLALKAEDLDQLETALVEAPGTLTVGFNRRHAPLAQQMHKRLRSLGGPCSIVITVNAGHIPADHWTQDPAIGGGRIVGEGCHFIDLARFLAGAPIAECHCSALGANGPRDSVMVTLAFVDGSIANINYLATGHQGFPKERVEVFCAGRILQLDNFRVLRGWGWPGFRTQRLWQQDKGQKAFVGAFLAVVRSGGDPVIPYNELLEVSRTSITAAASGR